MNNRFSVNTNTNLGSPIIHHIYPIALKQLVVMQGFIQQQTVSFGYCPHSLSIFRSAYTSGCCFRLHSMSQLRTAPYLAMFFLPCEGVCLHLQLSIFVYQSHSPARPARNSLHRPCAGLVASGLRAKHEIIVLMEEEEQHHERCALSWLF